MICYRGGFLDQRTCLLFWCFHIRVRGLGGGETGRPSCGDGGQPSCYFRGIWASFDGWGKVNAKPVPLNYNLISTYHKNIFNASPACCPPIFGDPPPDCTCYWTRWTLRMSGLWWAKALVFFIFPSIYTGPWSTSPVSSSGCSIRLREVGCNSLHFATCFLDHLSAQWLPINLLFRWGFRRD